MDADGAPSRLRVAVACSGLGHVRRGVETWAEDLSRALRQTEVRVKLFGGGRGSNMVSLPCLWRTSPGAIRIARTLRHLGGWRYGLGSPYDVEQTSFVLALWPRIRRGFDILHVQDPIIAACYDMAHRHGLCHAKVIYATGTGEDPKRMRRFDHLQLLTREAFEAWQPQKPPGQMAFMVPNFVETAHFLPGDRRQARAGLGLPQDHLIVLCSAAINRHHKRIDFLLAEFAGALARTRGNAMLVIAGAHEDDTSGLIAEGKALLGDRVRFLPNMPRDRMPDLYRAADLFVLASLSETFGIVLLEAMATGLPVICHDAPRFRTIVGPAGYYRDLSDRGSLASAIAELLANESRDTLTTLAGKARRHVEAHFSTAAVIPEIRRMYSCVLKAHDHVHHY
jgi:1,2-diacylglycerol 3-alpha-glucosyltransferase